MAQPFDASSLQFTGEPVPVVEDVGFDTIAGSAVFSVSENGTLVYRPRGGEERKLTWFDREGKEISKVGSAGGLRDVVLSPDGKKAAATRTVDRNSDIPMIDLERASNPITLTRSWKMTRHGHRTALSLFIVRTGMATVEGYIES